MPASLTVVVRARHGALTAETASCDSISSQTPQSLARVVTSSARPKKRKATCKARTDEIKRLQDDENELKAAVERFKQAKRATHVLKLSNAAHQYAVLQSSLKQSNGVIASARSLIWSALEHNPLYTRIRLPARSSMDRQLILGMARGPQLWKAAKYIVERVRFQNLNRSLRNGEIAEGEDGDFWFSQLDIMPFKGTRGVKAVLDRIDSFLRFHEFIVLESLDICSLVDTEDATEEPRDTAQFRIVSSLLGGVVMEKNAATFRAFYPRGSDVLDVPHALVVFESIDEDEAHPYDQSSRVRVDISSAILILDVPPQSSEEAGAESSVSLVRCSFQRLHKPTCGISHDKELALHEIIPRWGDLLCKTVRESVILHSSLK